MVRSFRCSDTEGLFNSRPCAKFQAIERVARRKLMMLNAATQLRDLAAVPGNRLEALAGNRQGQYSIRVNDQFRICFRWQGSDAFDVEVTDYH